MTSSPKSKVTLYILEELRDDPRPHRLECETRHQLACDRRLRLHAGELRLALHAFIEIRGQQPHAAMDAAKNTTTSIPIRLTPRPAATTASGWATRMLPGSGAGAGSTAASGVAEGAKLDVAVSLAPAPRFRILHPSINLWRRNAMLDGWNGTAGETEGYLQQSWNTWHETDSSLRRGSFRSSFARPGNHGIPTAGSATVMLTSSARLPGSDGARMRSIRSFSVLASIAEGNRRLLPLLRSNQAIGAVEQRLSARARFRAEFYNRTDRDVAERPLLDPRMIGTTVFVPPLIPLWANSERGWARGVEVFLQRSSANKFTGWVAWGWGRTGYRDGVTGDHFPSDFDQRNTISIYGSYRLRPSVILSVHSSYGSGFPIPEYLTLKNGVYYLAASPDQLRIAYYQRTDLRINKSWTHDKWKFALYGEVVNLSNRTNYLFDSLNSYNTKTGQTSVTLDTMLPVIPSAGVLIER